MTKVKYYYDPRTLSYRKIERTWRHRMRSGGIFMLTASLLAVLLFFVIDALADSPKEKRLKRELSQMELQYEIMNKRMASMEDVLSDIESRDDKIYRVIFEADPVPESVRKSGFGGVNRYEKLEGFSNSKLIVESAKKIDELTKRMYVQSKSFDEVMTMAKNKESLLASIPAIQPVSNEELRRIASGFGYRIHPIYKVRKLHAGIDFSAPTGSAIYATGDGTVENTNGKGSGYGKFVMIDHGFGYETLYGHMSEIIVRPGQKVKRGDIIGYVGNTGRSTAPHLHYEVHKNGNPINPINFFFNDLSPAEYEALIEISSSSNQSFD